MQRQSVTVSIKEVQFLKPGMFLCILSRNSEGYTLVMKTSSSQQEIECPRSSLGMLQWFWSSGHMDHVATRCAQYGCKWLQMVEGRFYFCMWVHMGALRWLTLGLFKHEKGCKSRVSNYERFTHTSTQCIFWHSCHSSFMWPTVPTMSPVIFQSEYRLLRPLHVLVSISGICATTWCMINRMLPVWGHLGSFTQACQWGDN